MMSKDDNMSKRIDKIINKEKHEYGKEIVDYLMITGLKSHVFCRTECHMRNMIK